MKDTVYFEPADCDLAAFAELIDQKLVASAVPQAATIEKNVPIYDIAALGGTLVEPEARQALLGEWATVLGQSSGVLVLRGAYADTAPIDAATRAYEAIIASRARPRRRCRPFRHRRCECPDLELASEALQARSRNLRPLFRQ